MIDYSRTSLLHPARPEKPGKLQDLYDRQTRLILENPEIVSGITQEESRRNFYRLLEVAKVIIYARDETQPLSVGGQRL